MRAQKTTITEFIQGMNPDQYLVKPRKTPVVAKPAEMPKATKRAEAPKVVELVVEPFSGKFASIEKQLEEIKSKKSKEDFISKTMVVFLILEYILIHD